MAPFSQNNVIVNGILMSIATDHNDKTIGEAYRNNTYLWSDVHEYLKHVIKPGSRVIDAGANIGTMAIYLAKIEPTAIIYCFEPDPINFSLLRINIELNHVAKNVHIFNCALGKEEQYIPFYKMSINHGDHRCAKPFENDSDVNFFTQMSSRVQMVNPKEHLRRCLANDAPQYIDLLKTDTQGADFEIIDACRPLFRDDTTVVAEFSPYLLHRFGTTIKDVENVARLFSGIEKFDRGHHPMKTTSISREQLCTSFNDLMSNPLDFYDIVLKGPKTRTLF